MSRVDPFLKLYSGALNSPYLHYAYWDDPEAVKLDELSLSGIVAAQERYIERVAGRIPDGVRTVLDAGCGIGGNAAYLEALYRGRGRAERQICDTKATGLTNLPSHSFAINHAWLQIVRGNVMVDGVALGEGDGASFSDTAAITIESKGDSELIVFDLA